MKRSLTLTLLLGTMLAVAACAGSDTGRSERAAQTEPQRTQAEPAQRSATEESTQERVPSEAAESEQGTAREGGGSSGLSVTTIEGEEVRLGGQGDVTALFFMAGW
jgi:hypothetical protein